MNNKKLYNELKDALYRDVGERLVSESAKNQELLMSKLQKSLDDWEVNIRSRIKEILLEEKKSL